VRAGSRDTHSTDGTSNRRAAGRAKGPREGAARRGRAKGRAARELTYVGAFGLICEVLISFSKGRRDPGEPPVRMRHNSSLRPVARFWGALVAAASSKQNVGNPSGAVVTPEAETMSGQPVAVSAADLALLRSLTAKIREVTEAESANAASSKAPAAVSGAADPALVQAPSAALAPAARPAASSTAAPPLLDSTQTVRALTPTELTDSEASRWFAIELMLSPDQIDAAEVPNLEIFDAYRLYSVTGPDQGRIIHALRLGFFSSETAAQSVARYLTTYFTTPTIRRVSIAEHERFAERLVTAGKDIGASGMHAVIELAGTPAPRPQVYRAKATPTVSKPPRGIGGLLWPRPSKAPGGTDR
jgi:hypothetical protein